MFNKYQLTVYNRLIDCYKVHMTDEVVTNVDSNAMLAYYDCYKGVLRETRKQNKQVYEESTDI